MATSAGCVAFILAPLLGLRMGTRLARHVALLTVRPHALQHFRTFRGQRALDSSNGARSPGARVSESRQGGLPLRPPTVAHQP
eukprot:4198540-Lingulodinium_polyedra.AAC.1